MKSKTIIIITCLNLMVFVLIFYVHYKDTIESNNFLIKTYEAEGRIQDAQLSDVLHDINERESRAYLKGFEAGRTQAGVAFLHNGTMQSYADGYHAAISQWGTVDPTGKPTTLPPINIPKVDDEEEQELLRILEEDIRAELQKDEKLFKLLEKKDFDQNAVLKELEK